MADRCHFCGYRLDGLPDKHHCPECGFAFDRSAEVITQSSYGPIAYLVMGCLGVVMVFIRLAHSDGREWWQLGLLVTFLGFVFYGWRCLRQRNRAILTQDGLCILGRFESNVIVMKRDSWRESWKRIGEVRWPRWGTHITIHDTTGSEIFEFSADFFGANSRGKEFVKRASAWIREVNCDAYCSSAAKDANTHT